MLFHLMTQILNSSCFPLQKDREEAKVATMNVRISDYTTDDLSSYKKLVFIFTCKNVSKFYFISARMSLSTFFENKMQDLFLLV